MFLCPKQALLNGFNGGHQSEATMRDTDAVKTPAMFYKYAKIQFYRKYRENI